MTHPSHEVNKVYIAEVRGKVIPDELKQLRSGVDLEDGKTAPAKARLLSYSDASNTSTVELTIHEGRKRQVRRMLAAVGHKVIKLARVRLGSLDLEGLREGQYRFLTKKEVSDLIKLATPK
jgi:23S rRNA pseudouridine2605 synthase